LTPLLLALGASIAWGVSDFVGPLISRTWGTLRVMFWAQIGGCAGIALAVAVRGQGPESWKVVFAVLASIAGTLGLYAYYRGMATGAMSVVAPIAGASAVIPVVFGVLSGDKPSGWQVAGIAFALVGVALASIEHSEGNAKLATGVGLALLAARGFGLYFPPMHVAGKADFWWASFLFRATALLIVSLAVVVQRPALRMPRKALLIALAAGIGDMIGNALFAASSSGGLVSLTAVLASLYPIVTVLLAAAILHERVASFQKVGIVLTLTGVVLISI
jgi:drug/metabolite transporter (DMT)-like permease